MADITVIPIFGLHQDVIDTVMPGGTDTQEDDTIRNQLLDAQVPIPDENGEDSGEYENVFLAVEQTQSTEDLGKWFFLTMKRNEEAANDIINTFVIVKGQETPVYQNHANDGDSYKLGIRRSN